MEDLRSLNLASNPLRDRKYLTMTTAQVKDDLRKRFTPEETLDDIVERPVSTAKRPIAPVGKPESRYKYVPKSGTLDLSPHDFSTLDLSSIDLSTPITALKLSSTSLTRLPTTLLPHPSNPPPLPPLDFPHTPPTPPPSRTPPLPLPTLPPPTTVSTGLSPLDPLITTLPAPKRQPLNISCHRLSGPLPTLRPHFPDLTTLIATDNWFTSLTTAAVQGLEVLDVRNNEIDHLPPHIGMLAPLTIPARMANDNKHQPNRLRVFEVGGNKFRVPTWRVVERGSEAVLRDLRRMVPLDEVEAKWRDE